MTSFSLDTPESSRYFIQVLFEEADKLMQQEAEQQQELELEEEGYN